MTSTVQTTTAGHLATVRVDDGKANALSPDVLRAIHDGLAGAEADEQVRVIVLLGRPGMFSGGFDRRVLGAGGPETQEMIKLGSTLLRRIYSLPKPVVAGCTGHAIAMGGLILLASDIRVGVRGAFKIGLTEVQLGMTLPDWAMALAEARISRKEFQRATTIGHPYAPDEAEAAGYFDRVVEADALESACAEEAERLLAVEPRSYSAMVKIARGATIDRMTSTIGE